MHGKDETELLSTINKQNVTGYLPKSKDVKLKKAETFKTNVQLLAKLLLKLQNRINI